MLTRIICEPHSSLVGSFTRFAIYKFASEEPYQFIDIPEVNDVLDIRLCSRVACVEGSPVGKQTYALNS